MSLELALQIKRLATFVAHQNLLLSMHLVEVLAEIGVFLSTLRAFQLMALMHQPYMLPQVAVLLSTNGTGGATLVMHIGDVSLQICFEVAAVTAVATLVVLQLAVLLVYVVFEVGEFPEAMRAFGHFVCLLSISFFLLPFLLLDAHFRKFGDPICIMNLSHVLLDIVKLQSTYWANGFRLLIVDVGDVVGQVLLAAADEATVGALKLLGMLSCYVVL